MQGEILAPKNQQQKPYDLIGSVSTLLSFSSLLTFVWSGDGYFPIAQTSK